MAGPKEIRNDRIFGGGSVQSFIMVVWIGPSEQVASGRTLTIKFVF